MPLLMLDLESKRITTRPSALGATAYTDLLTDTLYSVSTTSVVPINSGAVLTGLWRSARFVLDAYYGFAWLRLTGNFSAGAVVRMYADGALVYTTPTILSADPIRLPAGRFKRVELELESADRFTNMTITSTTQELQ